MSDSTPPSPTELALQALTTAAWVAVPDYVTRPWPRRAVRLAIVAGTTGAYVLLDRQAPQAGDDREDGTDDAPPPRAVALVAAGVVASLASARGSKRVTAAVVRRLEARGVRRPWTVVGVGLAAVTAGMRAVDTKRSSSPGVHPRE